MSSLNVPSIGQILTMGNIGDISRGIASGGGYLIQNQSYNKLDITNSSGEDLNV